MTSAGTHRRTTFGALLRARSDAQLDRLLTVRPDLAVPPPTSFLALAAAASARSSLNHALAGLDTLHLAICESVVALDLVVDSLDTDDMTNALGVSTGPEANVLVRTAVDHLVAAAILWDANDDGLTRLRPSPGLADLFGPYPAGLGPSPTGTGTGTGSERISPDPNHPSYSTLGSLQFPADAPPGADRIVAALAWGPPVGVVPASAPGRAAVRWLAEHHLVVRTDDRHVVLPRTVGLALRGGRTHRELQVTAPELSGRALGDDVVDGGAALAGLEAVRLVGTLIERWAQDGPSPLRAGGLAVRDLRRLAAELGTDEATAVLVVEIAAVAELVTNDGEAVPVFRPTAAARTWIVGDSAERWAGLACAWWESIRTPWLVGSRDARGTVQAALDPELTRAWVPRLRGRIMAELAAAPAGLAVDRADVLDALRWRTPRSVPPEQAIAGLLDSAAFLGITDADALSSAGRVLTASRVDESHVAASPRTGSGVTEQVRTAFAAMLPPEVNDLLLQGDLTGIVPGRPGAELSHLVELAAVVESRGPAMTLRFTPESIARALEQTTADELTAELGRFSRVGIPQPLEYLVRDIARRQGSLRIGVASAYLRSDDAALLAGLAARADFRQLGLMAVAPTVLVSNAPAAEVHAVLRSAGITTQIEGPGGVVVQLSGARGAGGGSGANSGVVGRGGAEHRGRSIPGHGVGATHVGRPPGDAFALASGSIGASAHDGAESLTMAKSRRQRVITGLREAEARSASGTDSTEGAHTDAGQGTRRGGSGAPIGSASTEVTDSLGEPATQSGVGERADADDPRSPQGRDEPGGCDEPDEPRPSPSETVTDPAEILGVLREAIADQAPVWIEMVGPGGTVMRRRVRPLTLDAGRLRAVDPEREAEVTVAAHRIASVRREA